MSWHGAASHPTRVLYWCTSWRTPRVVLVDILGRKWDGIPVDTPVLWVSERLLLAEAAEVHLTATGGVVAVGAADEAALGIPEGGLAVVARGAGDVGAALGVDVDEGVDGVP